MKTRNPPFVRLPFLSSSCGVFDTDECGISHGSKSHLGKLLLGVSVGLALTIGAGAANAMEAKVSGQLNRALMYANDGTDSALLNVDNNVSSTRFRFTGSEDIAPGVKAGIVFENEFESNASNAVSPADIAPLKKSDDPTFKERHANIYLEGGFGNVSFGQGDGAANGGTEVDLSGTDVVQGALATNAIGGAILFRNGAATGPSVGATTSNQDFESRYDRLRYDTPSLGPVKLAIDTGYSSNREVTEAALWFSGALGGGRLAGALGKSTKKADPTSGASFDQDTTGGSVSWLAGSGINLTLSYSKKDVATNREGKFSYFKVGYRAGQHAFSADFGKGTDQAQTGDEAKVMGLAWVYQPVKWADIYATMEKHSLDRTAATFDDIQIIMVGSRIKF